MFNKRILAAPVIALAALAMSAPQALSGGHPNRAAPNPHAGAGARPSGAIHHPPQGHKPSGGLNYHPTTSKKPNIGHHPATANKPIGAAKHPGVDGKTSVTPKGTTSVTLPGRPKPGVDRPTGDKLPPGVTSLPSANSDRRWWGWGGRWWAGCCDRDERCCRHDHECCHHCPWWSRGCSAGNSPTLSSSATIETQPAAPITPETSAADIIDRMSRALESDRPAKSVDDPPQREKRN